MGQLQKEEMDKLQEIREKYNKKVFEFGRLFQAQIELESQFEELQQMEKQLRDDYLNLQKEEKEYAQKLEEKYGKVEIDLDTGVITELNDSNE